jgi:prepilin-type N-terminal cleavage/methylation domain-containing protein
VSLRCYPQHLLHFMRSGDSPMVSLIMHRKDRGFTLIEALVTLLVIGVMAAIVAPSFFGWLTAKNTEDALSRLEGALKEAQSTAVKKNRSCTVMVGTTEIKAVKIDAATGAISDDFTCLPTGSRTVHSSAKNIAFLGTAGSTGTPITFSLKGSTPVTQTTEAILVRRTDTTSDSKIKCLVISSGVGLVRAGNYSDSTIPTLNDLPLQPTFADPSNPTASETTAYNNWKSIKDARDVQVTGIVDKCITPT